MIRVSDSFEKGKYIISVIVMVSLLPLPPCPYRKHGTINVVSTLSLSLQPPFK